MKSTEKDNKESAEQTLSAIPISWFPGHMTKTKRQIEKNLKLVDIIAEIVDARLPMSSRNPDLDEITINKPRVIILNKGDMADKTKLTLWLNFYKSRGFFVILVDSKSGRGLDKFIPSVKKLLQDKLESAKKRGILNKSIRIMVVGIPNVGKSSFINKMLKSSKAKVADKPGVTRGSQWFSIGQNVELLDTPGVLWPKFQDELVAEKLAFCGAIKDGVLDIERLSIRLIGFLKLNCGQNLIERYKLSISQETLNNYSDVDILEMIAKKRGMLVSNGKADCTRAAIMLLDEFRDGKLGKFVLDDLPE